MGSIELAQKVAELRELRRMAAELDAEIEALQNTIKGVMSAQGVDTITGADFKISWTLVESQRFDKYAMIQTFGVDCYNSFCKPIRTRRFTIA